MFILYLMLVPLLFACALFDAQAQTPRIGILVPEMGRPQSQATKGLMDELRRLGYQEPKNIAFAVRDAKRDRSAFQPLADELVRLKVDVIFTTGTSATRAAAAATEEIPIVFVHPSDPSIIGFMEGPQGPRRNLTGVAAFVEETTDTQLALLKEIVPGVEKLHILYDWNNRNSRKNLNRVESSGKKWGYQVVPHGMKSREELQASLEGLQSHGGEAIFQIPDDLVESAAERIFEVARQKKIATLFNGEVWAIRGALAAYGPSYREMGRQAGILVDQILKGKRPSSLSIQRASKFDLTLNYRTARFIGVHLTPDIIKKADRVIR